MRQWLSMAVLVIGLATPAAAQSPVLDRILGPDALGDPIVWVPDAVNNGMFALRIAMAGQVPLVFEAALLAMPSPPSGLQRVALTGKSVRGALDLLVATDPRYSWNEVNGVMVIRPLAAWGNEHDPLNAPVANVNWANVSMSQALTGVVTLLGHGAAPSEAIDTAFDDRVFSVAMPSGSVLDVLIESARAHGGLMWFTPDTTQHPGYTGLSVGVTTFSGRGLGADVPVSQ